MPHYSYLIQDYYYYQKELLQLIDIVEIDRMERRANEKRLHPKREPYLKTTFKEDLIKLLKS
jgi:c-di-GMP-related signal transduction protein